MYTIYDRIHDLCVFQLCSKGILMHLQACVIALVS